MTPAPSTARIFDPAHVEAHYQPIVDLLTGTVVGAEALARWPALGVSPTAAFAAAERDGRRATLDRVCQEAAIAGTRGQRLDPGFTLFVNAAPGSLPDPAAAERVPARMVVEVTERSLLVDPAALLVGLGELRAAGWGIALDDVGSVEETITMLPFVRPDVVKLDLSVVQGAPGAARAAIVAAVGAYAERSGAAILAEGVETEAHLRRAWALGATLGQGWYFAPEGPLAGDGPVTRPLGLLEPLPSSAVTPSALVDPNRMRVATKRELLAMSRYLESQAQALGSAPVVLAAFEDATHFTAATSRRYAALGERCPLVVALGAGMAGAPCPGVRGAALSPDDPLSKEWAVVVVGAHYTGALLARDLGDGGPDLDRRFRVAVTHAVETVLSAARCLLGRVDPLIA